MSGTFAEKLAFRILSCIGFDVPEKHSRWNEIIVTSQACIDEHVDAMQRVAEKQTGWDRKAECVSHRWNLAVAFLCGFVLATLIRWGTR